MGIQWDKKNQHIRNRQTVIEIPLYTVNELYFLSSHTDNVYNHMLGRYTYHQSNTPTMMFKICLFITNNTEALIMFILRDTFHINKEGWLATAWPRFEPWTVSMFSQYSITATTIQWPIWFSTNQHLLWVSISNCFWVIPFHSIHDRHTHEDVNTHKIWQTIYHRTADVA